VRRLLGVLDRHRRGVDPAVWALLALALVVRLAFFLASSFDAHAALDPIDYDRHARSIAAGHGFPATLLPGARGPSAYRPPAYPYFLGAVYWISGHTVQAARLVQAVLGVVPVALLALIAWRLWGRRAGLSALALGALAAPLIVLGDTLESEWLLVGLELAALAAVLEQRRAPQGVGWAALAGVLAGLAMLTRVNAVLVVLALAAGVWTLRPRLTVAASRAPVVLVVCAVLVVLPWTVRNAIVMHSFIPISDETGYTLAGTYNDFSRTNHFYPGAWVNPEVFVDGGLFATAQGSETALSSRLLHRSLRYIARHPAYPLSVAYHNSVRLLGLSGPAWDRLSGRAEGLSEHVAAVGYYGFLVLALLAVPGLLTRAARRAPLFLWAIPVLLWLSVALVQGESRFRAPIDPFIVLLAALGVAAVWERLRPEA
jgi:4-amino-4-deoxy-L-arabinose transferase-like glycosyltransferase